MIWLIILPLLGLAALKWVDADFYLFARKRVPADAWKRKRVWIIGASQVGSRLIS